MLGLYFNYYKHSHLRVAFVCVSGAIVWPSVGIVQQTLLLHTHLALSYNAICEDNLFIITMLVSLYSYVLLISLSYSIKADEYFSLGIPKRQKMLGNCSAISWREQINFWWDDDEVCFLLDQHTELDFYRASLMQHQSAGRHVAPLGHIILIPKN
jgi:hypothetical protein